VLDCWSNQIAKRLLARSALTERFASSRRENAP
jgi:hypothetical protein